MMIGSTFSPSLRQEPEVISTIQHLQHLFLLFAVWTVVIPCFTLWQGWLPLRTTSQGPLGEGKKTLADN